MRWANRFRTKGIRLCAYQKWRPLDSRRTLRVHTRVRLDPSVPLAILDEARAEGMSCIAMSTHGRHGLTRLALGSVTDKVVRGGDAAHSTLPPFHFLT
jgi:nucleotide-binding universal stress UspA family protein